MARLAAGLFCAAAPGGCAPDPPPQIAVDLIEVTGLDRQPIAVNPSAVVALKSPRPGHPLAPSARCAVLTLDGKFVSVIETCAEVERRLEGGK